VKSLAIIYADLAYARFFQAAVSPDTTLMLGIEEPETHLHPQAVRILQAELASLPAQTLVSTHSPQFLERVPLEDVRRLSKGIAESALGLIPEAVHTIVPNRPQLGSLVADPARGVDYDAFTCRLSARRLLAPTIVSGIASLYADEPRVQDDIHRCGK
jgi:putative ATP-dependent endonuclease of OLD family